MLRAAWQRPFNLHLDTHIVVREHTYIEHILVREHIYTVKKVVFRAAWQRPFDLHDAHPWREGERE